MDYENVLFHCKAYYATRHLARNCPIESKRYKGIYKATWWEGDKVEHYMVNTDDDSEDKEEDPLRKTSRFQKHSQ